MATTDRTGSSIGSSCSDTRTRRATSRFTTTSRASAGREAKEPFLSLLALVIGPFFLELVWLAKASFRDRDRLKADLVRRGTYQTIAFFVAKTRATGRKRHLFRSMSPNREPVLRRATEEG